ncbi:MAG TPA: tetratricopeptide repeat protein, partial [Blastocatellia bacterium]|nr:tetratricopeptide repeat protein [Blastocatellia bacterium]
MADQAYWQRQIVKLEHVSNMLLALPLPPGFKGVGRYYRGMTLVCRGRHPEARDVLERVAEGGALGVRARALVSLGASEFITGDFQSALPFYVEAGRIARQVERIDPLVEFGVHKMIAAVKGEDGDHRRSVDDLERIFPLARMVGREYRPLMSDYLNSYAVELAAVGRLEEASNVSRIVLASPYASAYPEWRETFDEIAGRGLRPSRSVVGFCETASRA